MLTLQKIREMCSGEEKLPVMEVTEVEPRMVLRFKSELAAKFAREATEEPSEWIIVPDGGRFQLVRLPAAEL